MRKFKIDKNKASEWPKFPVGYGKKTRIMVPYPRNPREGICDACARTVSSKKIRETHLHHWYYKYKSKTLKKNPFLVLENLSELCYSCHQLADALARLFDKEYDLGLLVKLALLMPRDSDNDMQRRLERFCKAYLAEKKKKPKVYLNEFFEGKI